MEKPKLFRRCEYDGFVRTGMYVEKLGMGIVSLTCGDISLKTSLFSILQ
jgi:hypothetical protein